MKRGRRPKNIKCDHCLAIKPYADVFSMKFDSCVEETLFNIYGVFFTDNKPQEMQVCVDCAQEFI